MAQYECTPVAGGDKFTVTADKYEFDTATRTHTFKDAADNLVATQMNVNVRRLDDPA